MHVVVPPVHPSMLWCPRFDKGTKELAIAVQKIVMVRLREGHSKDVMSG